MSTLPISRSFGKSRDSYSVPYDVLTSNLVETQRRESDFEDVHIYDASDISRIVHTYGNAEKRENTSSQESAFLGFRNWSQDGELTSDYEPFTAWAGKYARNAPEPYKSAVRWDLVIFPAFLKGSITDIPDMHLLDAMRGWKGVKREATEKGLSTFTATKATICWDPDVFSGFLKTAMVNMPDTQLLDALHDWKGVKHEAAEEGFPVPTDMALENSQRMLISMYSISPRRFEVYPTPDGEVAIDTLGGFRRSVLLLCDSDGGALCLVNINGEFRRARYSDTDKLPDGFIREALVELDKQTTQPNDYSE